MPAAGAIRAARAYVELFADDSKLVRGLRRAQAKLKAFGRSVQQFGRQLLTVGSLAAVPFALSAQTFASFEAQMARVKALTGATGEQFTRLEQEAKRLGATTVFSASQAAERMSSLAMDLCIDGNKLFGGHANVASDLSQQHRRDVTSLVEWHGRASTVSVTELFVRAALSNLDESQLL